MKRTNHTPVTIIPLQIGAMLGYDVQVNTADAMVFDYVRALEDFIDTGNPERARIGKDRDKACKGCQLCCGERIPLTLADLASLALFTNTTIEDLLKTHCHIAVEGPVVDMTLPLESDGFCLHLDRREQTCRIYGTRPVTCRTFICCPATKRASRLREAVINAGEDALVRFWLDKRKGKVDNFSDCHEVFDPCPSTEDYRGPDFSGLETTLLKDICPSGLWSMLTQALL